ncbi:hypothetical protein GLOIN_2v1772385 [Rhizophagus clarus]|uniref:Uncharacterized protein n=1 Tax=Rhizophagus clarus TaxID=94130 RepID=A0A8H3MBR6_9GLOM|nr:hypothetical protein GLOIN_2v1772385 [Rhizophagus clarus]
MSRKFIEYLNNMNKRMRIIHNSSVSIRNEIDHIKVLDIDKTLTMNENYNEIIKLMHDKKELVLTISFYPNIIFDLRKNGGFKGTKFDKFWDEMDYYFNEIISAMHERRHITMIFMPVAISIRELHKNIIECLKTKHDEETFSKIPILMDDKHKVLIGEIVKTSTGVRNKATLASLDTELTSCDHNFTKLSVTPLFSLFCEIFVEVFIKDKYLFLIKIQFFNLVQHLGILEIFDFLAAVQMAPYHSWTNPAERVISIINLGLQGIKKYGESNYLICGPVQLSHEIFNQLHYIPDPQISSNSDHYQDFDSSYGQNTTEKDIPSKKNHYECKELAPSGVLVTARVHDFVFCISCLKLHCLFSQYALDDSDYEALQAAIETFAYTCNLPIVPKNHFLYNKIFIYYYCGEEDNLIEPSQEILSQFQTVYPLCEICQEKGKNFFTKSKIQIFIICK